MSAVDGPISGTALEVLDAFLGGDRAPPDCMPLTELDGFLTGIAIGPELLVPSEWLPIVWGGEPPLFASESEAQEVLNAVLGRYNEILHQIGSDAFAPVFTTLPEGTVIAAEWAEGFVMAMGLRINAWQTLLKSKRRTPLVFPILALCRDDGGRSALDLDRRTTDQLAVEAPALIPSCVAGIAAFWRERRGGQNPVRTDRMNFAARVSPRTGRNDPCPCGSGLKFKRCCGRAA